MGSQIEDLGVFILTQIFIVSNFHTKSHIHFFRYLKCFCMIQMNKKRLEKHIRNLRKNIQVIFRWTHELLLLIKHLFSPVLGIDNSIDTLSVFLLAYSQTLVLVTWQALCTREHQSGAYILADQIQSLLSQAIAMYIQYYKLIKLHLVLFVLCLPSMWMLFHNLNISYFESFSVYMFSLFLSQTCSFYFNNSYLP